MDHKSIYQVIRKHFEEENFPTIVLAGKSGTGKTWMARKVSKLAVKEDWADITLWVCQSHGYSQWDLYEHIAHQLSLFYTSTEWENDDNEEAEDVVGKEETVATLKEKICERLSGFRRCLLVLDDERNKMNEGDIITELLQFLQQSLAKPSSNESSKDGKPKMMVLITSLNEGNRHQDIENTKKVIVLSPLALEMSVSLLRQKAGEKVFNSVESSVRDLIDRKKGLTPVEVGLLAKLLSYHQDDSSRQRLERALKEASLVDNYDFAHLIGSGYDKIPDNVLLDFSWQGSHYFQDNGPVHYNALISYWIMEGYLGPVDCVEKAYEEGHRILVELMDCGMLKKVKYNHLIMKRANLYLNDRHRCGIGGTAKLGLANVFVDGYKGSGFGRVTHINGAIKTLGSGSKGCQLLTLLLDGNCFGREDFSQINQELLLPKKEKKDQELQILGLFSPRIKKLPQSLPELKKLNVLVLRGCDSLESIDDIKDLNMLTVLEVSGSRSLTSIPSNFFLQLTQLRSLNLSALQIEVLPESVYGLTDLRWFILKDCSQLAKLKSLKKCEKLMVLDLSGAASLTRFPEKNLKSLPKLQMLNLSRTNIKSLPILHGTSELTHLILSGCRNMNRLPSLRTLTNLQVLDLSESTIKEFHDKSLQSNTSLKILDLSGTDITSDLLPSNISNPCELYMKGCSEVKHITCTESPKDLEILDLSGACFLAKIDSKFFEHLENLRVLNLAKTKVAELPSLSALHNLRELLLSCCSDLVNLPTLTSMTKLEVLDLSDCKALTTLEDESFERLSRLRWLSFCRTQIKTVPELKSLSNLEELNLHGVNSFVNTDFLGHIHNLHTLDLSDTSLEQLPRSLSNLKSLKHLRLRGCRLQGEFPPLEELHKLEILDLSHTEVKSLPSLERLSNLRELLLRGCSKLEQFANIRMVGSRDNLPSGISKLEKLEHLSLPNKENTGAVDNTNCNGMEPPEEKLNEYEWSIRSLSGDSNRSFMSVSSSEFFELLKSDPSLRSNISKHFYFSVHPTEGKNGSGYLRKDEFVFRDIYFLSRHFADPKEKRSMEIHDFDSFPKGIEDVLNDSEYIFLFANSFINSLVDLGADNIKKMKGCWVEGCQRMKYVIDGNDTKVGAILKILWISNALSLQSLCGESQQSISFQNLNCLYLDGCPELSGILFPSYLPKNLAILHIRFCEKLERLFRHDLEDRTLLNLHTLRLWELPELKSIGCIMPSLKVLEVGECPILEHVLPSSHVPQKLEVLKIRNCHEMDVLFEGITSNNLKLHHLKEVRLLGLPKLSTVGIEMPSLKVIEVGYCPMLVHVISSSIVPNDLAVLKVRFCDNMKILFEGITSENCALSNICTVHLQGLPKLTSIGITLPDLQDSIIRECLNLNPPVP